MHDILMCWCQAVYRNSLKQDEDPSCKHRRPITIMMGKKKIMLHAKRCPSCRGLQPAGETQARQFVQQLLFNRQQLYVLFPEVKFR